MILYHAEKNILGLYTLELKYGFYHSRFEMNSGWWSLPIEDLLSAGWEVVGEL